MAGKEAPELAVNHDGDRERCLDTHVPQILEMDLGNGAQHAQRQVDRFAGGCRFRDDPGDLAVYIGDNAKLVSYVEFARLSRDIACGVPEAQKGIHVRRSAFRNDLSRAVIHEPINHDTIEIGHEPDLPSGVGQEGLERVAGLDPGHH